MHPSGLALVMCLLKGHEPQTEKVSRVANTTGSFLKATNPLMMALILISTTL
jgi:hypothetical protein